MALYGTYWMCNSVQFCAIKLLFNQNSVDSEVKSSLLSLLVLWYGISAGSSVKQLRNEWYDNRNNRREVFVTNIVCLKNRSNFLSENRFLCIKYVFLCETNYFSPGINIINKMKDTFITCCSLSCILNE